MVFSPDPGRAGLDRPFRVQLTEEALQHPVFQIADDRSARETWAQMPTFTQYGRVDAAKPGAQIWIQHQTEDGPQGRRILMASQRYGAGISAVLASRTSGAGASPAIPSRSSLTGSGANSSVS